MKGHFDINGYTLITICTKWYEGSDLKLHLLVTKKKAYQRRKMLWESVKVYSLFYGLKLCSKFGYDCLLRLRRFSSFRETFHNAGSFVSCSRCKFLTCNQGMQVGFYDYIMMFAKAGSYLVSEQLSILLYTYHVRWLSFVTLKHL